MSIDLDQLIRGAIESTADRRAKGRTKERGPKAAPRALPQVSLLPVEVRGQGQARRIRGVLVVGVLAVGVAVGGAVAWASTTAADADARAAAATDRLSSTAAQLAKFKDVQTLQQRVALGDAAVRVGGSTAIDWQRWLGLLEADMPAGFTVTNVQADSATPFAAYAQGESPLEKPRAATVQITADTVSLDQLPVWLRQLKGLPAYADLTVNVSDSETGHTVQVTVHLTSAAYVTPLKGQ